MVALTWALSGCSGPTQVIHRLDPDKIRLGDARLKSVPGTRAQLKIPEGFKRRADRVWVVTQHKGVVLLLNVVRAPSPKAGLDAWLKSRIAAVQRSGQAGLIQDEQTTFGDLEGRYIEAMEVVGKERRVLFLGAVEAEDGVYLVSVLSPLSLHKRFRAKLKELVTSLRVQGR